MFGYVGSGNPLEVVHLASRQNRGQYFMLLGSCQNENSMVRRFFQRFQESVESGSRQHVHLVDDKHFVFAYLRRYPHLVDERAYIVHRVVRGGIELDDVVGTLFVESSARFAFVAGFSRFGRVETVDCFSENTGTRSFPYAARAAKQISMSEFVRVDRIFQSLSQCFLSYDRTERRWPVFSCRNDIIVHIDFLSSFANIVKGERRGKRKSHFWIDYAEPYLIYSTNIGKEEGKIK